MRLAVDIGDSVMWSPLEDWTREFGTNECRLFVKRDDLLPFPLPGNKVRKLREEFQLIDPRVHVVITAGALSSNHCRTTAVMAARIGAPVRLVLHGEEVKSTSSSVAERVLVNTGASWVVVSPERIGDEIERIKETVVREGKIPYVIPGGCHTPAGVRAYREAVQELASQLSSPPGVIVVASGTGATQAGIVSGCIREGWNTRVIGISVARSVDRGSRAVIEALSWDGVTDAGCVDFVDDYVAGGYGKFDARVASTVRLGWSKGLPLDPVYTGKAFTAVRDIITDSDTRGDIVFWHTGGLMQYLEHPFSDDA